MIELLRARTGMHHDGLEKDLRIAERLFGAVNLAELLEIEGTLQRAAFGRGSSRAAWGAAGAARCLRPSHVAGRHPKRVTASLPALKRLGPRWRPAVSTASRLAWQTLT